MRDYSAFIIAADGLMVTIGLGVAWIVERILT